MTTLFFLMSLVFGWLSYNLYRPIFKQPKLNAVSFLAGWLVGELAVHHIILQALLVSLFIWGGAVSGFIGALAFIICVTAWIAMVNFYLLGHQAKEEFETSLKKGLGNDYQSAIANSLVKKFPADIDYEKIRWPRDNITEAVEVSKNISYGSFGQSLDIYRSINTIKASSDGNNYKNNRDNNDKNNLKPILLQIHGGAWTEKLGSKNEQALPLINHMALRDWLCVAISYRLSPTATFPEHIIDCKEALIWIKKNIAGYGGNPDFIVVTGGSAGGHLCSLLALSANDPLYQPGFEQENTTIQGAIPFYGVYDFTDDDRHQHHDGLQETAERSVFKLSMEDHYEDFKRASPLFRISATSPPFCIVQGDRDTLVLVETARTFAEKLLKESNNKVVYAEISGAQHAFDMFPSIRSEHVKQGVERYLAWLYSTFLQEKDTEQHADLKEEAHTEKTSKAD